MGGIMKRKIILLVLLTVCLFLTTNLEARPVKDQNSQTRILHNRWMQVNDMNMSLINDGRFGQTSGYKSGFYWPGGYPDETYIFGAGMWIGGRYRSDTNPSVYDTLVTCGYEPGSAGGNEFIQGLPPNDDPSNPDERIYFSYDADWPLQDSIGGDSVISMLDSYYTYNDYDTAKHFIPENLPLDICVIQQTYAFTGYLKDDILFFVVNIILDTSKDTLHSAFISICADCDIGYESGVYANDLVGFDIERNMAFQWQNDPESGWTHFPGHIGFKFLQGTVSNGIDTVHYFINQYDSLKTDSIVIGPNDTIGMTSFKIFTFAVDPSNKNERYEMMSGYDYLLLNDSFPEESYRPFDEDKFGPADKRFILSSGPFNLIPGDTAKVIFTVLMGEDSSALNIVADKAQEIYDNGMQSVKEKANLVNNKLDIKAIGNNIFKNNVDLEYIIEKEGNVNIDIYDKVGRLVKNLINTDVNAGYHRISWNGKDDNGRNIVNGIYFVRIESAGKVKNTKVMLIK
jgi:hypothetical protein